MLPCAVYHTFWDSTSACSSGSIQILLWASKHRRSASRYQGPPIDFKGVNLKCHSAQARECIRPSDSTVSKLERLRETVCTGHSIELSTTSPQVFLRKEQPSGRLKHCATAIVPADTPDYVSFPAFRNSV